MVLTRQPVVNNGMGCSTTFPSTGEGSPGFLVAINSIIPLNNKVNYQIPPPEMVSFTGFLVAIHRISYPPRLKSQVKMFAALFFSKPLKARAKPKKKHVFKENGRKIFRPFFFKVLLRR